MKKSSSFFACFGALFSCLAVGQPDITRDQYLLDRLSVGNWLPGGRHSIAGRGELDFDSVAGELNIRPSSSITVAGFNMQAADIDATYSYVMRFSDHPYYAHSPFDDVFSSEDSAKSSLEDGSEVSYSISWVSSRVHPANAYDGLQGNNYPEPAGGYDNYSVSMSGVATALYYVGRSNATQYVENTHESRVNSMAEALYESQIETWNHVGEVSSRPPSDTYQGKVGDFFANQFLYSRAYLSIAADGIAGYAEPAINNARATAENVYADVAKLEFTTFFKYSDPGLQKLTIDSAAKAGRMVSDAGDYVSSVVDGIPDDTKYMVSEMANFVGDAAIFMPVAGKVGKVASLDGPEIDPGVDYKVRSVDEAIDGGNSKGRPELSKVKLTISSVDVSAAKEKANSWRDANLAKYPENTKGSNLVAKQIYHNELADRIAKSIESANPGYVVSTVQIRIYPKGTKSAEKSGYAKTDLIIVDEKTGKLVEVVELKTGDGSLSQNQIPVYSQVVSGEATAFGNSAAILGIEPGAPLSTAYPSGIEVEVLQVDGLD